MAKIVVGIDGSDASKAALRWAVEEAGLRRGPVIALHAWQPAAPIPEIPPAPPRFDPGPVLPELEAAAEALVRSVVEEVAGDADVEVTPVAKEGPAASLLVEEAAEGDLLVVARAGAAASRRSCSAPSRSSARSTRAAPS
jgi:nucleotide-binding universal stress UspA family protein